MKKALYLFVGWTFAIIGIFTAYMIIGLPFIAAAGALFDAADEL